MLTDKLDFMTTAEVADLINVHRMTVTNWRNEGSGPTYLKIGRSIRYERSAVQAWLLQARVEPKRCVNAR